MDDLVRDAGSKQLGRAAVERLTEHDKVDIEFFGALGE